MEKTRSVPFDFGAGDGTYYGTTASTNTVAEPLSVTEKYLRDKYALGASAASTPISGSKMQGYQEFYSTERKRPIYNDCVNKKLRGFCYPFGATVGDYRGGTGVIVFPYYAMALSPSNYSYVLAKSTGYAFSWDAAESASRRAWWSMQPRFEGRVSLLNSILELKDFTDIAKHAIKVPFRHYSESLLSLKKVVSKASRAVGRSIEDVKIRDIPQLLKNLDYTTRGLASMLLTKRLAIDPTIADTLSIMQQMNQCVATAQDDFKKHGEIVNSSHYREVLNKDTIVDPRYSTYNYYWRELKSEVSLSYTATMEYFYEYQKRPALRAMRKFWGMDLTAEVIWNYIPFTWVVDYFVAVGDSIHNMSLDPNVTLLLKQYCESLEYKAQSGYVAVRDPRSYWLCINGQMTAGGSANRIPLSGYDYTHYERRLAEPHRGVATPKLSWPSLGQAQTLAALLRCMI